MHVTSEELIIKIRNQITAYQMNVRSDNRAHRYNINDRAEAFTIPLFKTLFGLYELKNLNEGQANFPGIDLGDIKNRVAIQVTSDTSLEKIKHTIELFVKEEFFQRFDRLLIFMIQGKQKTYSVDAIQQACEDKLKFNISEDIIDLNDLLKYVKGKEAEDLHQILILFENETGYVEKTKETLSAKTGSESFSAPTDPPFENGFLNLIEVGFPDTLYIADWNFTKKQLGTRMRNDRKLVREALSQKGLRFSVDWVTIDKQIISFHDLGDSSIPLSEIIDHGTLTKIETIEFYENDAYKNKFIELLQRCLQQKLFQLDIQWQNQEKEFIFDRLDEKSERSIEWEDQRKGTRRVYREIPELKDNSRIYCHEHFAFATRFYEFGSSWYLSVTPDWFYSKDGYARALYAIEDKRSYKKRKEANLNVSAHVRFIQSYIATNNPKSKAQLNLFSGSRHSLRVYEHLWIKDRIEVQGMPRLIDDDWRKKNPKDFEHVDPLFS